MGKNRGIKGKAGEARKSIRTRRLIEILALLSEKSLTVKSLAQHFKVHPRTIQRDIKFLKGSGFSIGKDIYGRLELQSKEAVAKLEILAMTEGVVGVMLKNSLSHIAPFLADELDRFLPTSVDPDKFGHILLGLDYVVEMGEGVAGLFKDLLRAISARKKVRFKYEGFPREMEVEPYKLGYDKGFWYLVAGYGPPGADATGRQRRVVRAYSLDKMGDLEVLTVTYSVMDIPPFVEEMKVFRPYFPDGQPVKVRVRVSPPAVRYFERKKFVQGQKKEETLDTGEAVYRLEASSYMEIKNAVLKPWYPYVKVVEPESLAKEVFIEMETWIQEQRRLLLAQRGEGEAPTMEERFLGSMLGMAVGNALGMSIEFLSPGAFQPVTDLRPDLRPKREFPPGCWGGDTSCALALADSLLEREGWDEGDFMERLVAWRKGERYRPVVGEFPLFHSAGPTVEGAIHRFCGASDPSSVDYPGNASLARLAPVVLYYAHDPAKAMEMAGESSKTTHKRQECVDACRYFAGLLVGALMGVDKRELLSPGWRPGGGPWREGELHPRIWEVAQGSFKDKEPPEIRGTRDVVEALEAALWAFHRGMDYEECVLRTVNLGDDADTVGAICGQLAGAYYGSRDIPSKWLERLVDRETIERVALRLWESHQKRRQP